MAEVTKRFGLNASKRKRRAILARLFIMCNVSINAYFEYFSLYNSTERMRASFAFSLP